MGPVFSAMYDRHYILISTDGKANWLRTRLQQAAVSVVGGGTKPEQVSATDAPKQMVPDVHVQTDRIIIDLSTMWVEVICFYLFIFIFIALTPWKSSSGPFFRVSSQWIVF